MTNPNQEILLTINLDPNIPTIISQVHEVQDDFLLVRKVALKDLIEMFTSNKMYKFILDVAKEYSEIEKDTQNVMLITAKLVYAKQSRFTNAISFCDEYIVKLISNECTCEDCLKSKQNTFEEPSTILRS